MGSIQAVMPMPEIPHADGLVEPDGRTSLFDKEFNADPPTFASNLSYTGHQRTRCTCPATVRDNIQAMHEAHGTATPAGIAPEEGDEPDRLPILFGDQGFIEGIRPEAVRAKPLGRGPWSLSWKMVVYEAGDEGKEEVRVICRCRSNPQFASHPCPLRQVYLLTFIGNR